MARCLTRKLRETFHFAKLPSLQLEANDRADGLATYLLPDHRIEVSAVLVELKVSRALHAIHRLDDFRRAGFRIAFENMQRLLVFRPAVAPDVAMNNRRHHQKRIHFVAAAFAAALAASACF